ncbi:MAG: phosphatase PAP2 family protein, partial [Gemmatimonadota bacterium]
SGAALAGLHALAVLAGAAASRRPLPRWRVARFLRIAYPVALTPLLYMELAFLNRLLTDGYVDATVQAWEGALFGVQPSLALSAWLPSFPLSEFLHLGYASYYLIVPAALLGVWTTRGDAALHRTAFTVAATFFLCYVVFIVFPVAGPRYEFEPIRGALSEGSFFGGVHAILEGGSSKGTAFPSSHIAASAAALLAAGREDRRWLWALIVPETALAFGTVYCRFHYAVDALAGVAFGVAVWLAAPVLLRSLGARAAGREGGPPGVIDGATRV